MSLVIFGQSGQWGELVGKRWPVPSYCRCPGLGRANLATDISGVCHKHSRDTILFRKQFKEDSDSTFCCLSGAIVSKDCGWEPYNFQARYEYHAN